MAIDILENPTTNPTLASALQSRNPSESGGLLSSLGSYLSSGIDTIGSAIGNAAVLGKKAIEGTGQYVWDTFAADKNSVPSWIRAAVASARTATDKLNTLRQYYPDAMPSGNDDFTFIDPVSKKRVTLNDPGWSVGDMVESLPEIGEVVGGTLGGLGGAVAGGGVASIATGAAGAGAGGVAGSEIGRGLARGLSFMGNGFRNAHVDTSTMGDVAKEAAGTFGINALGGAIAPAWNVGKSALLGRLLTQESPQIAAEIAAQGYKPTIGQIGSPAGKEIEENLIKAGIAKPQAANQQLYSQNVDQFVGPELANSDSNQLANALRSSQQDTFKGKKDATKELYKEIKYSDEVIAEAPTTKGVIETIYKKGGYHKTPEGKYVARRQGDINPDYVFDASVQRKLNRIAQGNASERELDSLRSDITTILRKGVDKRDTKEALEELQDSLTKDLVQGNKDLSEADRAARAAYHSFKQDQKTVENILKRTEGVTDKSAVGVSKTEGETLENAKTVFSSSSHGSDSEAAALGRVLAQPEKDAITAAILNETKTAPNKVASKYNLERMGSQLIDPAKKESFDNLMAVAPQIRGLPEDYVQRSALNPKTLLQRPNQLRANLAVKEALKGSTPESLAASKPLLPETATIMTGTQGLLGNVADSASSNMRIPQNVIDEALPEDMKTSSSKASEPLDFDSLIAPEKDSSIDFDSLIGMTPSQDVKAIQKNSGASPGQTPPPNTKSLADQAEAYMAQNYRTPVTMEDAEKYMQENYRKNSQSPYTGENKAATKLLEELQKSNTNGRPYYQTSAFLEGIKESLAPYESGRSGYSAQAPNSSAAGKYQFINSTRQSIVPGISREEFMNNPAVQEVAMDKLILDNINTFKRKGIDVDNMDPADLAGLVWAAHLRGPSQAIAVYKNREYSGIPDANGTLPITYFNRGRNSFQNLNYIPEQ